MEQRNGQKQQAWRQIQESESSHLDLKPQREQTLIGCVHGITKPIPSDVFSPTRINLLNQSNIVTNWHLNVQSSKLMWDISQQILLVDWAGRVGRWGRQRGGTRKGQTVEFIGESIRRDDLNWGEFEGQCRDIVQWKLSGIYLVN